MSHGSAPYPIIQLLVFQNCPLAGAARESLRKALAELSIPRYEEIDILDPATSDELRGWGSPTILVDGNDLCDAPKGDGAGCRVYAEPDGVPSTATIVTRIRGVRIGNAID